MYRYKYDKSYHHKSRQASRTGKFAAFVCFILLLGGLYVAYDTLTQVNAKTDAVSSVTHSSVQGESTNLFRTEYFQFQANDNWKEISTETKPGHYRYASYNKSLLELDLTVDINGAVKEVLPLMRNTHVLPVTITAEGKLNISGNSGEHCKNAMAKNSPNIPTRITERQVSFVCTPDAVVYQVAVGVISGSTTMAIPRPGGPKTTYTITYRDLTVDPTDNQLLPIIASFQSR